jgi:type II secretory pathway pseudopilin PulG
MTRETKRNEQGSALLMVLMAIVVMGLTLGVAGSSWKTIVQREREQELYFRGDQYRRAIADYHNAWGVYPKRLEDLLEDRRALYVQRHIRRLYPDPMTGRPFELVRDDAGTIKGVYSADEGQPFRRDGFPPEYDAFVKATSYRDWVFLFEPGQDQEGTQEPVDSAR